MKIDKHYSEAPEILKFDLNGNFVKEYSSIEKACKSNKGSTIEGIKNNLDNFCKSYLNYIWRYKRIRRLTTNKDYKTMEIYPFKHQSFRNKSGQIAGLHKQNGIIMLLYKSGNFKFNESLIEQVLDAIKDEFDEEVVASMKQFMEQDERQLDLFQS